MNSLYLFYNASIQGSFALMTAATRSKKVRAIWMSAVVAGFLQDQMLSMMSEEDEDGQKVVDKIPDYVLEHNFVIKLGGLGGRSTHEYTTAIRPKLCCEYGAQSFKKRAGWIYKWRVY